jgi:hypothetical protein
MEQINLTIKLPLTKSGLGKKPQNKAPILLLYRGFLFYLVSTEDVATIECKVNDLRWACSGTISQLALYC